VASWLLAVNIGAISTTAAVRGTDRTWIVAFPDGPSLPSVVFLSPDGRPLTGASAAQRAAAEPDRAMSPGLALAVADSVPVAGLEVPVATAYAALLATVARQAAPGAGSAEKPERLIVTHPAGWVKREFAVLSRAAATAGLPAPQYVPEPIAAAWQVARRVGPGGHIAIFSAGDYSFDTCVLQRTRHGFVLTGMPGGVVRSPGQQPGGALSQGTYELLATITRAGLSPRQLDGVHLVGPAADTPGLASRVTEILGVAPRAGPSPATVVVLGALAAAGGTGPSAARRRSRRAQPGRARPRRAGPRAAWPAATRAAAAIAGLAVLGAAAAGVAALRSAPPAPKAPAALAPAERQAGSPARPEARPVAPRPQRHYDFYLFNDALDLVTPMTAAAVQGTPIRMNSIGLVAFGSRGKTMYLLGNGINNVTPFDPATNTFGPPIVLRGAASSIAIAPDGKAAYALDTVGIGLHAPTQLTPIDTVTGTPRAPVTVHLAGIDGSQPEITPMQDNQLAITPDGRTVYILDPARSGSVIAFNTATDTVRHSIPVGQDPGGILVTPDGKTLYVANTGSGTVTPVSTATDTPGPPIVVGGSPASMAITPDGTALYTVGSTEDRVSNTVLVTPIDTATNTARSPVPVHDGGGDGIAITPDGTKAFLFGAALAPVVSWIDTATDTASPPIHLSGLTSADMAFTPDSKVAYVLTENNSDSTLTPINVATGAVGRPARLLPGTAAIAAALPR
jgi:YVTN family beta-propeller protein